MYVPSTSKIISSYDVLFDESFSIYVTTLFRSNGDASRSDVYTICYVLDRKTGDIITFAQFEEGKILTKTLNDAESRDKFNNE